MHPAALPSDATTIVAVLFLLFGVPAILLGLLFLYTGYVRYDAELYLEQLEDADLEDGESTGSTDAGTDSLEEEYSVFDDGDEE